MVLDHGFRRQYKQQDHHPIGLSLIHILLTGAVEKEGEEELLSEELERADILKAAHHGSKNSTSNEFLQKVQPKQTVISCGKQNRYGHPHLETIHRLQTYHTKIYRTDRSGAIIFFKRRDG